MVRVEKIWQIVDLVCGDVYRQLLFFLFWCEKMDFVCIEDLGFGACDTSIPAGEADVF